MQEFINNMKNVSKIIVHIILLVIIVASLAGCDISRGLQYKIFNDENNGVLFLLKDVTFKEIKGGFGNGGIEGQGVCVNKKSKQYTYVKMKFVFYDERGKYLGVSDTEIYEDINPNETFKIRISVPYAVEFRDVYIDNTEVVFEYE